MPCESYHWHYDYPRLAWDSGFCFNSRKSKDILNRNEIGLIDIERIIKERDISTVDRYLQTVIECKLDEEQLKILEPSFAKLFRLSQLSLEYVEYCKEYLDHTVVLLKKEVCSVKEINSKFKNQLEQKDLEIVKLKKKNRDLKDSLNIQQNVISQYPVPHQIKSTLEEKFLLETDKLQSEIKELKEKLNSKERFYKDNLSTEYKLLEKNNKIEDPYKFLDLQKQFDLLKEYVNNELKHLQGQKHDSEKLEEWGQFITQKITECAQKQTNNLSITTDIEPSKLRRNSQTQTESEMVNLQKHFSDTGTNPIELKSESSISLSEIKSKHNKTNNDTQLFDSVTKKVQDELVHQNESNFGKLGEALEKKVTNTIESFEDKMEQFFVKLDELEKSQLHKIEEISKKMQISKIKQNPQKPLMEQSDIIQQKETNTQKKINVEQQHVIKTQRQKYIDVTKNFTLQRDLKRKPMISKEVQIQQNTRRSVICKPRVVMKSKEEDEKVTSLSESASSSDTQTSLSDFESNSDDISDVEVPKKTVISERRAKICFKDDTQVMDAKENVQDLVNMKLKSLGLSPDWKRIPNKSYNITHEIIEHQIALHAKQFNSYWKIQRNLLQALHEKTRTSKTEKIKDNPSKFKQKPVDIIKSSKPIAPPRKIIKSTGQQQIKPTQKSIERQRLENIDTTQKMYATDSESEVEKLEQKNNGSVKEHKNKIITTLPYDLITELKEKQQAFTANSEQVNRDGNDNFSIISDDHKQKSNLKNFPSINSLAKKKVLFNVVSDEISSMEDSKKIEEVKQKQGAVKKPVDNASSSSIDSTVLDGSKTNLLEVPLNHEVFKKRSQSDEENLDWDISDILC